MQKVECANQVLRRTARSISRREFLRTSGVAAAGAALAACAPLTDRPAPRTGQKVQLVYQDWRTDWFPGMAQQMLEEFHASHPNIRVFFTPDPEHLEERMLLDMEAGTAPDVMAGCCDFLPIWAQQGHLLDLRPYVDADLDRDTVSDWDAAQYRAFFTQEGLQYALPKYHGALGLYYNKDLFDAYGTDYPEKTWTHDDYLTAMRRFFRDWDRNGQTDVWGSMVDVAWERIQVHVNAWGGHLVDPKDPTRSAMAEPEALEALEWLRHRIWDDQVMASALQVRHVEIKQAFIDQDIVMVEDGSWALKDILSNARFRVGVVPFPAGPAKRVTLATTDGFGIYAGTRHPDAAWELLKFLISKEYGRAMARANFLQPARESLVDEWVEFVQREYPGQSRGVDVEAFAEGHRQGYSVTAEVFPNMAEARRLARPAWEQILTLGHAPVELMKEVSRQIEDAQRVRA
jgi:multiple sugar transport system substrate-binding protein